MVSSPIARRALQQNRSAIVHSKTGAKAAATSPTRHVGRHRRFRILSGFSTILALLLLLLLLVGVYVLVLQQHSIKQQERLQRQEYEQEQHPPQAQSSSSSPKRQSQHASDILAVMDGGIHSSGATKTPTNTAPSDWYFNNISVQYHDDVDDHASSPLLPIGRVSCVQHSTRRHGGYSSDRTANMQSSSSWSLLLSNETTMAWLTRSCLYTNLCMDMESREFLLFDENAERDNDKDDGNTHSNSIVSIGGINPRWAWQNAFQRDVDATVDRTDAWLQPLQWQPIRQQRTTHYNASSYYRVVNVDSNHNGDDSDNHNQDNILLLFHSMAGHNVGHLLWDDLYALYTSLRLWGLVDAIGSDLQHKSLSTVTAMPGQPSLSMMRHVLTPAKDKSHLFASCDIRQSKRKQCASNLQRFAAGLGIDPDTLATTKTARLHRRNEEQAPTTSTTVETKEPQQVPKSTLVCFPKTLVGLGLLTDHGLNDHGWEDYTQQAVHGGGVPHNLGKGRLFYDFAQYWIQNTMRHSAQSLATAAGSSETTPAAPTRKGLKWPPQITFSLRSSRDWARRLDFTDQINALQSLHDEAAANENAFTVQSYAMYDLSLAEQVQVAADTSIFITACGGGSMTATFLPRNAVLIVVYDGQGGLDFVPRLATPEVPRPARLDADLLNHAAHLRVHWLPVQFIQPSAKSKNATLTVSVEQTDLFVKLIRHELAVLRRIRKSEGL